MTFQPAVREPMKAVAHNQQLDAPPSCLGGLKAIGVINLAAELADDPLDDVRGPRHPWMIEVSKEEWHLILERQDLPLQPAVLKGLPPFLPHLKPEAELLFRGDIEQPGGQLQEALNSSARALVEIAEVVLEILLPVADTDLQGKPGKDLSAGAKECRISIHNEALKGIADFVSEREQQGLPVLRGFLWGEVSHGNIVRGGVGTEEKRVAVAFNVDGLSIEQQVTAPARLEFLSNLNEALAVLSQSIDPLKDAVGANMKVPSHGAVGSFPIEVEMSGAQDEAQFTSGVSLASFTLRRKGPLTVMTPPALNLARPQPADCFAVDDIDAVPLGAEPTTSWAPFFSPSSPPMVCLHTIERSWVSKINEISAS